MDTRICLNGSQMMYPTDVGDSPNYSPSTTIMTLKFVVLTEMS